MTHSFPYNVSNCIQSQRFKVVNRVNIDNTLTTEKLPVQIQDDEIHSSDIHCLLSLSAVI